MKKIVSHVLAIFIGAFTFISFSFNSLTTFVKVGKEYVLKDSQAKINGYELMKLWDTEFAGVMTSLFQVLIVVAAVLLVIYGVIGLLKEYDVFKCECADKYINGKYSLMGLMIYAGLNVLMIVFVLIYCGQNKVTYGESSAGVKACFGLFIPLILSVASVAVAILLNKGKKEEHKCHCGCCDEE